MRYIFILLTLLTLSACSYSPEMLQKSYNNLGKDYAAEIKQMGDLTNEQSKAIDDFGRDIQAWHRSNQLPIYTALMTRLSNKLQRNETLSHADLLEFISMLNTYPDFHKATASNYKLATIAKTISDNQLTQMINSINEKTNDFEEELLGMSKEKMQREHVRMVNHIMKFLGVNLTKQQLNLVRQHASHYHDQRKELIAATRQWNNTFFEIMKKRQQADFTKMFVDHLKTDNTYTQLLQYSPNKTKENDQMGATMLSELLASLSDKQQAELNKNLQSIGETLTGLMNK